jgi:hypothetical protein
VVTEVGFDCSLIEVVTEVGFDCITSEDVISCTKCKYMYTVLQFIGILCIELYTTG